MDNVLASLPSKVSPDAVTQGVTHSLKIGTDTVAQTLFETFTKDVFETTRLQSVVQAQELTCEQFSVSCKDALAKADILDAANGFVKPEGAKGQKQYGPVRRVLSQRLSECKQVFGAVKQGMSVEGKGYASALELSREFLKEKALRWNGEPVPTDAQRQQAKHKEDLQEATAEVMARSPQQPGESIAQWMTRIGEIIQEETAGKEAARLEAVATATVDKAVEKHGDSILSALLSDLVSRMTDEEIAELKQAL